MKRTVVLLLLSAVSAFSSGAAGICGNRNLSVSPSAVTLACQGESVIGDAFAAEGMFQVQGLSRKSLSLEFDRDARSIRLVSLCTNRVDTYWSVLLRQVAVPRGEKRRFRLSFDVKSDIFLSCGAHENGIWRNLIVWTGEDGGAIGDCPVVFSLSGKSRVEVSVAGEIPDRAAGFRLQLGFDAPDIAPGKSVTYSRLDFRVASGRPSFFRQGEFVSPLHRGGKVSWQATADNGTAVAFQCASGDSAKEALEAGFVGPDGTADSYYLKPFEAEKPFVRYRAVLSSPDGSFSPRLESVRVGDRIDGNWTLLGDVNPPLVHLASASPFADAKSDLVFETIDESPVLPETLRIEVDGVDRTRNARWDGGRISLPSPPDGWSDGRHTARVYVSDGYGNARVAQKFFLRGDGPRTPKVTLRDDGFALVDGKLFFPIGIYDVRKNAFNSWNWDRAVGDLAAAGFNLVHSYGTSAFDKGFRSAIAKYGMKHFVASSPWRESFESQDLHDPTVFAWYLADDTSRNTTAEELYDRVEAVRSFDPNRLTTHAEHVGGGEISVTRAYVDKIDGLMAEIYPVRDDTPQVASSCVARVISDMKRHHEDVRQSGSAPRFIWPIIQNFQGWGAWKRFPTQPELRAMSYAALVHGAHGIAWYKYHTDFEDGKKARNLGVVSSEQRWRAMTNLVYEVKTLAPVFADGVKLEKASCRIVSGAKKDPLGNDAVSFTARRHNGRLYVIAVSSVRSSVLAHFSGICAEGTEVEVWRENRFCRAEKDGGWTDRFSPFAVHVYIVNEKEEPFAFRKNLQGPHTPGRRDFSLKPASDEFVFTDGCTVPDEDFADYLRVSMGIEAKTGSSGPVKVVFDGKLQEREHRIEVSAKGVTIEAFDERAAKQAMYHLEDLMNLRRAPFLKHGKERRRSIFSPRMTHSGWALDDFPDGHLNQIAHYGFDAILIFVEGIDRTKGGRRFDIVDTIRRARKFGLDTYIYSYITAFVHPDDPGSRQVFEETYGKVAAAYPDAKGIVLVGESAEFPSRDERTSGMSAKETAKRGDSRPAAGRFPSRDYPDWINAVKRALHDRSPDMELVFWTYNWGGEKEDLRLDFIKALPKDVVLMATFEMYEAHKKRNGLHARIDDYSLCVPGPGKYFASEAKEAKRQGLRLFTMSNTGGLTWDFGTVPYLPMPYQWKRRYDALREANGSWGLAGLMENHHYGWYPSFVSELAKEAFTEGGMDFDDHIRKIAARDFGDENAGEAVKAWKSWSRAMEDYVATAANQYGPFRIGPAYPFNALRERIDNLKVPWPKDAINSRYICRQNFLERNFQNVGKRVSCYIPGVEKELELLSGMEALFRSGSEAFAAMNTPKASEMADLGEYLMRSVVTAANVKRGAIAETVALDANRPQTERQAARETVERLARNEYENAKAAIPLLERNSRLGWEPTMGYAGGAEMIRVKLKRMEERYSLNRPN